MHSATRVKATSNLLEVVSAASVKPSEKNHKYVHGTAGKKIQQSISTTKKKKYNGVPIK